MSNYGSSITLLFCLLVSMDSISAEAMISLEYVSRDKIANKSIGLTEPSGLALSENSGELWVVSDDTSAVFRFAANSLNSIKTIPIKEKEMEGITLAESSNVFYTINEEKGRISCFSMADGNLLTRNKVSEMAGYTDVSARIKSAGKKSGFEGIVWHPKRESLFVVLEGPPGLMLEINENLDTILSSTELTPELGFLVPDGFSPTIDFSDLSFDATRDKLWVLSDQAATVFVFDLESNQVIQSLPLYWTNHKGRRKLVDKAEGLSISPDGHQLYVVSDREARLYRWDIDSTQN